ncbi:hypothetical protein WICPIJ_009935 [Wickerhamomyces pijperi]|uniref:rRNA-processing protein EFG1 n=1 Tax=Wickerhamomyces pijperi TaxID=599730 RepID=A0A9P8PKP4_WICPI|nr:hypothetical protein WICPIJ_009935 [Wickerhamomyces pijperi]
MAYPKSRNSNNYNQDQGKRPRRPQQRNKQESDSVIGQGTTKLRKRIRDIERQLEKKKDVLPSNIKLEKQRELSTLRVELQNLQNFNKAKDLAKKYQMVRFFEKKKALRSYNQIKKEYTEMENSENVDKKELKKLRKKLTHHEIDLAYVVNFPKDKKYIALYPREDADIDMNDENVKKGTLKTDTLRNEFKKQFEQQLKEGTLKVSIEEILKGKSLRLEVPRIELAPDAPELQVQDEAEEEEEDDFFE